jgi:hypothetical protein
MASWFDEIITPSEREELEDAVRNVNRIMQAGFFVARYITDLIDARFPNA